MVYHQKQQQQQQQQQRKVDDEEQPLLIHQHNSNHQHPKLYFFLFSFIAVAFLVVLLLSFLIFPSCLSISSLSFQETEKNGGSGYHPTAPFCSDVSNNTICCDRTTSTRSDVCVMRGDIRTHSISSSIHLYSSTKTSVTEKIRPYTRKWEKSVMDTVDELKLVANNGEDNTIITHKCDVQHDVPAVVFSTGGYTGNVYHEFNDGIIPLYITSQHFNKKVVFVIVEYHDWWLTKYGNILKQLSDYDPIDFSGDNRTHCFPEAIVGLKIHDELAIDSAQMIDFRSIIDFRRMLDRSYRSRIEYIEKEEEESNATAESPSDEPSVMVKPRLVIVSRNGSRGLDNEADLVSLCEEIGFDVRVLRPDKTTELARIYRELNDSDVMIGVHGAAMTHLLFMRPKTAFIQIVPLGTDWAAEAYYGEPAKKMGLKYVEYKILPKESSLYDLYDKDDPVLNDPSTVAAKGWQVTKEVYLDGQNVKLDLNRFLKRITRVYQYAVRRKNRLDLDYDWSWQQPSEGKWQMHRR